jgi:hypothetical protein
MRLVGDLSPTDARALLKLHFPPPDVARMQALSARARAGTLTGQEEAELDAYKRLDCLVDMLHSRARRALAVKGTPQIGAGIITVPFVTAPSHVCTAAAPARPPVTV